MLFGDTDSCIAHLESEGYIILPPVSNPIKNYKELVKYFYTKVKSHYNIQPSDFNWKMESGYAKTFIKQLSPIGKSNDSNAIKQACIIIDALVEDLSYIEKYYKLDSMRLFIKDNTGWLIERAVSNIKNDSDKIISMYEIDYERYLDMHPLRNDLLEQLSKR